MSEKATKAAESTETKPSILFIVGSLRKQSLNGQLAQVARTALGERATTSELAWADVPVFSQDIEFPAPEAVRRVRKAVADADALWIVSPEYNHGVPGGLKNLIDWLSRPVGPDEGAVIEGKVATVSSVAGSSCGRYAQAALLPILDFLKLELAASPFTSVAFDREQFTTSILAITEGLKADLAHQAAALLAKLDRA